MCAFATPAARLSVKARPASQYYCGGGALMTRKTCAYITRFPGQSEVVVLFFWGENSRLRAQSRLYIGSVFYTRGTLCFSVHTYVK